MCGRYSTGQLSLPRLAEQFQADPAEAEAIGDRMSWNVTPTSEVLVVTATSQEDPDDGDAGQRGPRGSCGGCGGG
jgi:putative SOS response-associated peptidase YedK